MDMVAGKLQGPWCRCPDLLGPLAHSNCCDRDPGHKQEEPWLHPCRAGQGQAAPKRAMQALVGIATVGTQTLARAEAGAVWDPELVPD
ncbi:MAG: hypothetical protein FRX49_03893 [Trebouxia sp. A1-2]|nr:MAG: hypothetical protein FRX49_03893 [Trebouxia sp. A1-2]